jgi:hypothetical protein
LLSETEIKDEYGNIVIQPGLKVRHKKSQFEYTVEDVMTDPDENITVILKLPEESRFDPPEEEDTVMSDGKLSNDSLHEVNPNEFYYEPDLIEDPVEDAEEKYLAVTQSEFEKDYEVK